LALCMFVRCHHAPCAAALCATAICVPLRFACAAPAGEGRCGQSTCDIRDYAARSLPIVPGFRHGSPPLDFDNDLKGRRVSAHRFLPHMRAFSWRPWTSPPTPCCKKRERVLFIERHRPRAPVKTLRIHVAKVSLSNRPLFECLVIAKTNPDRCDFKHMPGLLLSSSFCFCFCFYFVLLSLSLSLLRKLEYVIILFQFMLLELLHPRILIIIRMCHIIMRMCHTIICSLLSIMVYWFARLEGIEGKAMP